MGNCFSDMEGGKQAVGGAQKRPTMTSDNNNNNGGYNDAVDFFFKSHGLHPLFTQMEVLIYINKQFRQLCFSFQYLINLF